MVRGEAYNLTNTPQFEEPQRDFSLPSFGRITNTLNDGRVLQIGSAAVVVTPSAEDAKHTLEDAGVARPFR
jgi:hypothetical protein